MNKIDNSGLVRACATFRGGSDAEDEHSQGGYGQDQLDVLAIDLAGDKGEAGEFVFHGIYSFFVCDGQNIQLARLQNRLQNRLKKPIKKQLV